MWGECEQAIYTAALNDKGLPVKYQVTANRLWYVAKLLSAEKLNSLEKLSWL